MALSLVVPLLNEVEALPAFLPMVDAAAAGREVVFCDGGSTDGTLGLLRGQHVVEGARGRGQQCRAGVEAASGDAVLFLHVDSVIEPAAVTHAEEALAQGAPWGSMTLAFDEPGIIYAIGAFFSNLRVAVTSVAFGDQGMFMTKAALAQVGGVPPIPLMEDYELSRRLRTIARPMRLPDVITTSARRFVQGGPLKVVLEMRRLRRLYRQGVPPEELLGSYGDVRGGRRP